MNYELAKELKDAGFPTAMPFVVTDELHYDEPTLSELIEACGEDFVYLIRDKADSWRAWNSADAEKLKAADGSTPEEAVARLWLALNKK